jgi:hypothetical protein
MLHEAMKAFEKSKMPGRKFRTKTDSTGVEQTTEKTYRDGDPRWLDAARALLEAERKCGASTVRKRRKPKGTHTK